MNCTYLSDVGNNPLTTGQIALIHRDMPQLTAQIFEELLIRALVDWRSGRRISHAHRYGLNRYSISKFTVSYSVSPFQFVRMPGGRRDNGKLQAVCYLDPAGVRLGRTTP